MDNFIVIADLHLTSAAADAYRWEIFDTLAAECVKGDYTSVILLGDVADFKDNHGSEFVNLLVAHLVRLSKVAKVHFVMGNHDMIKQESPFFEFIQHIPNVFYHKKPTKLGEVYLLPFTKGPEISWKDLDLSDISVILMHQPCIGARSSDFYELESGMSSKFFSEVLKFDGLVFSGDIHIPQVVGDVEYVGAPYPVRMGDDIEGRCIGFKLTGAEWSLEDIMTPSIKKWSVEIGKPDDLKDLTDKVNKYKLQDQMKVKVKFSEAAYKHWREWVKQIKAYATDVLKVAITGVSLESKKTDFEAIEKTAARLKDLDTSNPLSVLQAFCKKEAVPAHLIEVGKKFITKGQ